MALIFLTNVLYHVSSSSKYSLPRVPDGNPFAEFPSNIINGLERLEELSCAECGLGPSLPRGFAKFNSAALKVVNLAWNKIARLEPTAIIGRIHCLRPAPFSHLTRGNEFLLNVCRVEIIVSYPQIEDVGTTAASLLSFVFPRFCTPLEPGNLTFSLCCYFMGGVSTG